MTEARSVLAAGNVFQPFMQIFPVLPTSWETFVKSREDSWRTIRGQNWSQKDAEIEIGGLFCGRSFSIASHLQCKKRYMCQADLICFFWEDPDSRDRN